MKVVTAVKELVFRGPKVDQHTHDTHSEMLGMALIHTKVTFGPPGYANTPGLWSTPAVCQQGAEQDAPI